VVENFQIREEDFFYFLYLLGKHLSIVFSLL
jgi:hypothetical protein